MSFARRALVALPDAAAAGLFLWCWIAPLVLHQRLVGLLVLVLLMEFIAIQAGPFLGTVIYGEKMGLDRRQRLKTALGLGTAYLLFAGIAAVSFDAWWPSLIFAWLVGAKVFAAVVGRDQNAAGREPEMTLWILSAGYFFVAIFVTMFVPIPVFGITEDGEVYGLRGQYEWANFPYKAIAAGFFYFGALALTRVFGKGAALDLSRSDPAGGPTGDDTR